jgi:hypothetical protein
MLTKTPTVDAIDHSFGLGGAGIDVTPKGRPMPRAAFPLVFAPCVDGTGWWKQRCTCTGCAAVAQWFSDSRAVAR